eukprot:6201028-Pleurochrysis_carterae.AAC.1
MSPINDTRCGFPSTPARTSSVLRVFTRSQACGCTCHVQPPSTVNVIPLWPLPRACRLVLRRSRPAKSARAVDAGPRAITGT